MTNGGMLSKPAAVQIMNLIHQNTNVQSPLNGFGGAAASALKNIIRNSHDQENNPQNSFIGKQMASAL